MFRKIARRVDRDCLKITAKPPRNLPGAFAEEKRKKIRGKILVDPSLKGLLKRECPINSKGNPQKNLPEAFPEYPEIANKPFSISLGGQKGGIKDFDNLRRAEKGLSLEQNIAKHSKKTKKNYENYENPRKN